VQFRLTTQIVHKLLKQMESKANQEVLDFWTIWQVVQII